MLEGPDSVIRGVNNASHAYWDGTVAIITQLTHSFSISAKKVTVTNEYLICLSTCLYCSMHQCRKYIHTFEAATTRFVAADSAVRVITRHHFWSEEITE